MIKKYSIDIIFLLKQTDASDQQQSTMYQQLIPLL